MEESGKCRFWLEKDSFWQENDRFLAAFWLFFDPFFVA
jgi:hypothetical protein